MSNSVQFPSHKAIGTAEIQNNSCFPRAAQKGLEAGSTIQSSSSEGFFSAIITKIVNFFKWIFCCGSSETPKKLSEFGKYFENNIKRAWTQYSGPDDDTARVEAAVCIVEGGVGNMEDPERTLFRFEVAQELMKSGLATDQQKGRMNEALQNRVKMLHGVEIDGATLEQTLQGFADQKNKVETALITGAKVSTDTPRLKEHLMLWLGEHNFTAGKAVDNGDCFFAAYAEALSNLKGEQFTHKQMRQDVAKAFLSGDMIGKIVKDGSNGGYKDVFDWEEKVVRNGDEGFVPMWGRGKIEGVLLCNTYNVDLVIYDVYESTDEYGTNKKLHILENEFLPESERAAQTIYMAGYPGHFFPIFPKK